MMTNENTAAQPESTAEQPGSSPVQNGIIQLDPEAKGGVVIIFFAAAIILHIVLARNYIPADWSRLGQLPFLLELIFHVLLVIGCIHCIRQKAGWKSKKGIAIVFVLFALYAAVNIVWYRTFLQAYLTGFHAEYESTAGALVGLKLFLVMIGIVAGIPISVKIDKYEYSRRLKQKVQLQNASYEKASAINAKKDLQKTIENLRSTMTKEEFDQFMADLKNISNEAPKEEETNE